MQERAAKCRVAYRFPGCQRGPCSRTHAESSSLYIPHSDSCGPLFFDCHTNPELMLSAQLGDQVVSVFDLPRTKEPNDAYGSPPCLLHVTVRWHHVGCWRGGIDQKLQPEPFKSRSLPITLSAFVIRIIKRRSPAAGGWNSSVSRHFWLLFLL